VQRAGERARPYTRAPEILTPVQACGSLLLAGMRDDSTPVVGCEEPQVGGTGPGSAGKVPLRGHDWRETWEGYASFPSGHMREVAALAVVLGAFWRASIPFVALYAALIAFSRLLLGSHYATDVVGGTVIGVLSGVTTLGVFAAARRWAAIALRYERARTISDWFTTPDRLGPRAARIALIAAAATVALLILASTPAVKNILDLAVH
jgi:hypothetical protein